MTHGSLFSGIGGFDLAAEWMGWDNQFHCEWNPFGQKVLKHYWPSAESFTDITKTDFKNYANRIDILTGGFPCQPYSSAGKRLGKEDARHLWPEMLRAVREIQPRYVVGENVRGLTNWNGGVVFDEVQSDLETEGYEVLPFLLPAGGVNAPHRRDRIWFISRLITNASSDGFIGNKESTEGCNLVGGGISFNESNTLCISGVTSDSNGQRLQERIQTAFGSVQNQKESLPGSKFTRKHPETDWSEFPTQPAICSGNDGISSRLDGITFSDWRTESIKAAGNAIVPQVAYQIFKAIEQYSKL